MQVHVAGSYWAAPYASRLGISRSKLRVLGHGRVDFDLNLSDNPKVLKRFVGACFPENPIEIAGHDPTHPASSQNWVRWVVVVFFPLTSVHDLPPFKSR